jgi:hypothetical protein
MAQKRAVLQIIMKIYPSDITVWNKELPLIKLGVRTT